MPFNFDDMLVDEQKAKDGIRLDLGETGGYLVVSMPGNPEYLAEDARLEKEYRDKLRLVQGDKQGQDQRRQHLENEKTAKLWFRTVFIEWGGLSLDGKDFRLNEENCIELFTSMKLSRVAGLLVSAVTQSLERGDFNALIPSGEEKAEVKKKLPE